ncbi:MAG: glycosyltransferase [Rikenellaceae bacterium]
MNPEISVIVPVYNVAKYIRECIESILAQTFVDFELILVDDGSPDSSGVICDEYQQHDNRISVIHKKNSGVSDSRNVGILASQGKWIVFVDSDDVIVSVFLEQLYDSVVCNNVDIAIAKIYRFDNVNGRKTFSNFNSRCIEGSEYNDIILNRIAIIDSATVLDDVYWFGFYSCIYRKSIMESSNIKFPRCKIGEDSLFLIEYLLNCKSAYLLSQDLYGYRLNLSSAMNNFVTHYLDDVNIRVSILKDIYNKYGLCRSQSYLKRLDHHIANKLYEATIMLSKDPQLSVDIKSYGDFCGEFARAHSYLTSYYKYLSLKKRIKVEIVRAMTKFKIVYNLRLFN